MIGLCPSKISWARLKHIVQEDGSLEAMSTLGRSSECFHRYHAFKKDIILKEYASILDYVMINIFECQRVKGRGTSLAWFYHCNRWHMHPLIIYIIQMASTSTSNPKFSNQQGLFSLERMISHIIWTLESNIVCYGRIRISLQMRLRCIYKRIHKVL